MDGQLAINGVTLQKKKKKKKKDKSATELTSV